jgi:predicted phage terminase large subunit-like protein
MRDKDIYSFSSQMMQNPTPRGGAMFKFDWVKLLTSIPEEIRDRQVFIIGDTAMKTGEHNDYSVLACFVICADIDEFNSGITEQGCNKSLYLVDMVRGKWEAPELLRNAREFWTRSKYAWNQYGVEAMYVEDKASGTGLIQTLKRDGVPVIAIQRDRDKVTRAYSAAPFMQSGRFYIRRGQGWTNEYIDELLKFSPLMTHIHDDQCDVTFDAIEMLTARTMAGAMYHEDPVFANDDDMWSSF